MYFRFVPLILVAIESFLVCLSPAIRVSICRLFRFKCILRKLGYQVSQVQNTTDVAYFQKRITIIEGQQQHPPRTESLDTVPSDAQ